MNEWKCDLVDFPSKELNQMNKRRGGEWVSHFAVGTLQHTVRVNRWWGWEGFWEGLKGFRWWVTLEWNYLDWPSHMNVGIDGETDCTWQKKTETRTHTTAEMDMVRENATHWLSRIFLTWLNTTQPKLFSCEQTKWEIHFDRVNL